MFAAVMSTGWQFVFLLAGFICFLVGFFTSVARRTKATPVATWNWVALGLAFWIFVSLYNTGQLM